MSVQTAAIVGPSSYPVILHNAWRAHLSPKNPRGPTVISTFAGAGGSSLGYSMAGYRELLAVEWNDNAAETLRLNFPGSMHVWHGDICKLDTQQVLDMTGLQPGALDVLDGSPPCQGFSTAGRRIMGDPRNQLFIEYVRLLRDLQPRVFVMENVSGMVKGKMKLIFAEAYRALRDCGYQVSARVLNAMYFGVPQSRERMIVIGVREDLGIEPTHPKPTTKPIPVSVAIGDLGNVMDPARGHVWLDESPTGRHTKNWALAHQTRQGQKYAYSHRRDLWNKPASTLTTGGGDALGLRPYLRSLTCHPIYTRTYSQLEMRRLASFPEPFRFAGEWHQAVYRIGNSVPPLFMRAIAEHLLRTVLEALPEEYCHVSA